MLCLFIRSEGLQVSEKTRLITLSGTGKGIGGGRRLRDERNRWGSRRIRGKKGIIERGEEEKKLSRTDGRKLGMKKGKE